jgi:hypothetical protein
MASAEIQGFYNTGISFSFMNTGSYIIWLNAYVIFVELPGFGGEGPVCKPAKIPSL